MSEVITAVFGAGRIGRLHADNLRRMPSARLTKIADPEIDASEWQGWDVELVRDPEEVLSDPEIEAVLICSPAPTHAPLIEAAARTGKHVFCEKPLDLDLERATRSVEAATRAGIQLQVGFNRRFDPTFRRLRRAVVDGEIGELHLLTIISRDPFPPSPEYVASSGGLFLDMTIHDFDMVRFLSGAEIEEVHAFGAVRIDAKIGELGDIDTALITLRLTSGALAMIENSRCAVYGYDQRIEVFGSRGSLEALNETATRTRLRSADGLFSETPLVFFVERYREAFRAEIEAFVESVRSGGDSPMSGAEALVPLRVALAARRSLDEGRPVRLDTTGGAA